MNQTRPGSGWHAHSKGHSDARKYGAAESDPMKRLALQFVKRFDKPGFDKKEHMAVLCDGQVHSFGSDHYHVVYYGDFFTSHAKQACYSIHNHPYEASFHSIGDLTTFLQYPNIKRDAVACNVGFSVISRRPDTKIIRSRFDELRLAELCISWFKTVKQYTFHDKARIWGRRALLPFGGKPDAKDIAALSIMAKDDAKEDTEYVKQKLTPQQANLRMAAFNTTLSLAGKAYRFDVEFRDPNWKLLRVPRFT